jgi:hypothetical protein
MQALALLAAAATWSAPQTVSAPHTFAAPLFASADEKGNVLAAWGWQDGIGQTAPTGAAHVRVVGGAVSPEERAPAGLVAAQAYGDGRWVELADKQVDTRGQRFRLTIKDGATTTRLATAFILFRPQLSVAPDGSAIVAWVESHGTRHVVRAATRNASGRFSRPFTLAGRGQTTVATAAAGNGGRFLVAFVRNGRLLGRIHPPVGQWGGPHELSRAQGKTHWQLSAAVDSGGLGQLVWIRHRFTRPGRPGARELFAAGFADAFGSVQRLERDDAVGASVYPMRGLLLVAYAYGPNSGAVARVRYRTRPNRFGPALDAAAPQGGLRSVSAAGGGNLVVGWVIPNPSGDGGGIGYAAALDPNSDLFGPREQVTPNEAAFDIRLVQGAHGVRAFWTARPEGTGPSVPLSKIHTLVRTAVRSE